MTHNNERDWSDVVGKIYKAAAEASDPYEGLCQSFKDDVLRILQKADKTHNLAPETHKLESETLEFVPGELYEDTEGNLYRFIFQNKDFTKHKYNFIFSTKKEGHLVPRDKEGRCNPEYSTQGTDIIRKHTPAPKKHSISGWMNVYKNDDGSIRSGYHVVERREEADRIGAWANRVACLHIEREFVENEGIND